MCFAIVIMKLNQKVRLALGLESDGREKRSLEEKQGGSPGGTRRRGEELVKGMWGLFITPLLRLVW